jgi:hypothetical protein
MSMTSNLVVNVCVFVLACYGMASLLIGMLGESGTTRRLGRWIRSHDERALLNRQRKAARDREMRKVESTADRAAQMHEIFADVIHPTTPYCDYLDTPRDAMPRVRRPISEDRIVVGLDGKTKTVIRGMTPNGVPSYIGWKEGT